MEGDGGEGSGKADWFVEASISTVHTTRSKQRTPFPQTRAFVFTDGKPPPTLAGILQTPPPLLPPPAPCLSPLLPPLPRSSLHTACDAVDTKYVTQQWVARGLALPGSSTSTSSSSSNSSGAARAVKGAVSAEARQAEARLEELEKAKAGKAKTSGKAGGKGFGAGKK